MSIIADDTIIAQCTPPGIGALSLIRISGDNAIAIADRMLQLKSGILLRDLATHTIHYGSVVDSRANTTIDHVLILLMRAPKTFTGQDTVEITCHGNPFIVQDIINLAIRHGARHAQPGEFTQKAVVNGKLDIVRAEAIHELITAQTHIALKQSLAQCEGTLSRRICAFEHELLKALALSEASFEFIDEDQEFIDQVRAIITPLQHEIDRMLTYTTSKQLIKQGVRIALIGSVNTGKSSLFNTLLNNKRSIVSDLAGTTRDTVEGLIERHGSFITLIDTAGLRSTHDSIEREGIERAYTQAHTADLILLVYDGTRALTPQEESVYHQIQQEHARKIITIITKIDIARDRDIHDAGALRVSSHTRSGIDQLEAHIAQRIQHLLDQASSAPYLLTQRQTILLQALHQELDTIARMMEAPIPAYELISHHIKNALANLSSLTGKTISEQSMDLIFREFCIGK